ncbi:hypothetical protein [Lacihabitans soyangensis]|uniref:AAA family ATPase n=1 Tax=Lacihabitans soyangensis TaxID=869394 RepID=A0AAE3H0J7_9BACT|nr:hypothetical protein [Lacihabitans soyangensis]MCP9762658.1 hypothetical protein [Lacihabitans soyangensis]
MSKKNLTDALLDGQTLTEPTPEKPAVRWSDFKIDNTTDIPPMVPTLYINGSIMCCEDGIFMMTGMKKTGKSIVLNNVLATAFVDDDKVNLNPARFLHINTVKCPPDKYVIYLDNEQSRARTQKFFYRVMKKAELIEPPKNLLFYNLKRLTAKERVQFLKEEIMPIANKIYLIMLDGLVDFVKSMNDEVEAKEFYDLYSQIIPETVSTVAVMHSKPGGESMGHIGAFFDKKAVGAANNKKDRTDGTHTLECSYAREDSDFEEIAYKWDNFEEDFRVLGDDEKLALKQKTLEDKINKWRDAVNQIFAVNTYLDKPGVYDGIKNYDNTIKKDGVDSKTLSKYVREQLKKYLEHGLIELKDNQYFKTKQD